jgi:hypothetical protein
VNGIPEQRGEPVRRRARTNMFGEIGKSSCLSMQGGDVPTMTMIRLFPAKEYALWLTRAPKDPTLRSGPWPIGGNAPPSICGRVDPRPGPRP